MSVDPPDRTLFEQRATDLYELVVVESGLPGDDPRITDGGEYAAAFALLRELGLLSLDGSENRWLPVDPSVIQARVVTPLGQRGAELLAESSHWASAFQVLVHTWRRAPETLRGPFTELRGDAIAPYITSVVADATDEILTAQPQTGRAVDQLPLATDREVGALRRGVAMRTLYQHAARRSTATARYVAAVTAEGAMVRTLDEFFKRLIVVDRRTAIIPGADETYALAIREPAMIAYLVDAFERSWERARPFTTRESTRSTDIAAEQRAMAIRMLIGGHADPVGAARLGVSPRTYAAYIAELKSEFEADSRFQLGYEMGRRGINGRD